VATAPSIRDSAACASDWVKRSLTDPDAPPLSSALPVPKVFAPDPAVEVAMALPMVPFVKAVITISLLPVVAFTVATAEAEALANTPAALATMPLPSA